MIDINNLPEPAKIHAWRMEYERICADRREYRINWKEQGMCNCKVNVGCYINCEHVNETMNAYFLKEDEWLSKWAKILKLGDDIQ